MFRFNTSVHSYPTRISGNFHLTNPKLLLTHKSIRHSGPDIWNKFPDNIKSCTSVYSLKAALKRQIIQSYAPESITWNNAYYETIHVIVIFFLFKCTTAPCTHTCKCTAPTWSPNFLKRAMSPDFFFLWGPIHIQPNRSRWWSPAFNYISFIKNYYINSWSYLYILYMSCLLIV